MQTKLVDNAAPVDLHGESLSSRTSATLAALLAATALSTNAQDHLALANPPDGQAIRIEKVTSNQFRMSPSGDWLPLSYLATTNLSHTPIKWTTVQGPSDPAYVYQRSLTHTNPPGREVPAMDIKGAYADFPNYNGFVRLPSGVPREELTNAVLALHYSFGAAVKNAGNAFENLPQNGPTYDQYNLVSCFPTALVRDSSDGDFWTGQDGAWSPVYAYLSDIIQQCEASVPTIQNWGMFAESRGVQTALGEVGLHPEKFQAITVISGYDNPAVTNFLSQATGGQPVRFTRPIRFVAAASPHDEYATLPTMVSAAKWFAAANGFTRTPTTNVVKEDYLEKVAGPDATIIKYGPHVRLVILDAKSHADSLFLNANGVEALEIKPFFQGKMPGGE